MSEGDQAKPGDIRRQLGQRPQSLTDVEHHNTNDEEIKEKTSGTLAKFVSYGGSHLADVDCHSRGSRKPCDE